MRPSLAFLVLLSCRAQREPQPAIDPGAPPAAHITPSRYANAAAELFGDEERVIDSFPADGRAEGFDHIGSAMNTTEALVEAWESASIELVDQMFGLSPELSGLQVIELDGDAVLFTPEIPLDGSAAPFRSGTLQTSLSLPWDGRYLLSLEGESSPQASPPVLSVAIDDRFEGLLGGSLSLEIWIDEGVHTLELRWLNAGQSPAGERIVSLERLTLSGPLNPEGEPSAELSRYLSCEAIDEACASEAIASFGRAAWHKPLSEADVSWALSVYRASLALGETPEEALGDSFRAILMAPELLFTFEPDPAGTERYSGARSLDDHEIAARLAAFLWSSIPDEELLLAASAGELSTDLGIEAQVERMLSDPRARGAVEDLAGQWLGIREIDEILPDPGLFPEFDASLRASFRGQMERRAREFIEGDIDFFELITSSEVWIDERLAVFEGIPAPERDRFVQVSMPYRPGWLTQPGWLAGRSHPTSPSAVHRGYWILGQLLCDEPPPPPTDLVIPPMPEGGSVREREEAMRSDASCQACHAEMDPVGFIFGGFDAIGSPQRVDALGAPIDTSAEVGGEVLGSPADLAAKIASDPRLLGCVARRVSTYALARPLRPEDEPFLSEITARFIEGSARFPALAVAIAQSEPFRWRSLEGSGP